MSFPRYAKYKASGVEWLGEVPEHWELVRLKSIFQLVTEKATERHHPLGLENIEGWSGRLIETESEFEGDGVRFETGDLLFGKLRPYLAKLHVAVEQGEAVGDFHVMRPKRTLKARYGFYQLIRREVISLIDGSTYGAKMPRVGWDFLSDLPALLPPASEQTNIILFLDRETAKIDALVAEQERLIALLKEKRQAVISHAVTKGLDPNAPMKESGVEWMGKVPQHWGVIPLKRCCRIPNGLVDPTVGRYATLSLIAPNHVQSGTGRLLEVETADDQGAISGKYHFAEGTVLYSKIRPALRKACVAPFEGLCSADMYPIYSTKITPRLLLYQLLSDYFSSFAILSSDRVAMPKVNRETIGDFPMVVPPSAEQEVIVRYVDEAVAEIDRLGDRSVKVIERLRERRTALITAAVTGQIDVTRQAITETAK